MTLWSHLTRKTWAHSTLKVVRRARCPQCTSSQPLCRISIGTNCSTRTKSDSKLPSSQWQNTLIWRNQSCSPRQRVPNSRLRRKATTAHRTKMRSPSGGNKALEKACRRCRDSNPAKGRGGSTLSCSGRAALAGA